MNRNDHLQEFIKKISKNKKMTIFVREHIYHKLANMIKAGKVLYNALNGQNTKHRLLGSMLSPFQWRKWKCQQYCTTSYYKIFRTYFGEAC